MPGAARRDPGALRPARRRAHARRARVLDPAAPPEADRGVAVARARRASARGDGGRRRARLPGDRLRERRHVRVPARPGRGLLLHRAERAAPGRASGQRARDRDRHRPRAAARSRAGEALPVDRPRAAPRARDRDPPERRGSRARLRAGAGADHALPAAARARRARRHVPRGGRVDLAVLRLADREADRLGRGPRRRRSRAACARSRSSSSRACPTTRELALDILRSRGVPERRLLDELPRRDGGAPAVARAGRREARRARDRRAPAGTIRIDGDALAALVVAAAEHVDGARVRRPRRGLSMAIVEDGRAPTVELELAVRYGTRAARARRRGAARVAEALARLGRARGRRRSTSRSRSSSGDGAAGGARRAARRSSCSTSGTSPASR